MPVVVNDAAPPINYVGLTEEQRLHQIKNQKVRELNFARIRPRKIVMIAPDGTEEEVLADNVRDFVRLRGYRPKESVPSKMIDPSEDPKEEVNTASVVDDNVKASIAREEEVKQALTEMEKLRMVLRDHGVEPDLRWGKVRLKDEITRAMLNKQPSNSSAPSQE